MNIYYDNIVFWLQKSGGISRYWQELASRFIPEGAITFIEQKQPCENAFRNRLNMEKIIYEGGLLPLKIKRYLPVEMKLGRGIFHSSYYRDCTDSDAVKIVTVHDFTYEIYLKGLKRAVHTAQKRYAVRRADGVICISENTKADLLKFFPETDPLKVAVVHNGVGDDFRPSVKHRGEILFGLGLKEDRYAVFIGERSGYKNFDAAVKACALSGHFLLVIGGRGISEGERTLLESCLKDRYKAFGYVENSMLCDIYSIAGCLIYPSLYEGFGLPVLEAMRCGCPVVASACSSLPEAAGSAGVLVDEMTPEGYARGMDSVSGRRNDIIAAGFAHSANFSWDRCFSETKAFYERISANKS